MRTLHEMQEALQCLRRDCSVCGRTAEALASAKVLLDVYNDFDDQPGVLVCDDCVYAAADAGPRWCVEIARPEGYYHAPIGSFD